jgi:hypothetical protein
MAFIICELSTMRARFAMPSRVALAYSSSARGSLDARLPHPRER